MLLTLFHKFDDIRACGRQRTLDVAFSLKLVSVIGFKNSYSVKKQLHIGMSEKAKELLLLVDISLRDLVPLTGHPLKVESEIPLLSTLQLRQLFNNAIHKYVTA